MCTRYISIPLFFYLFQKSIINIQLPLHIVKKYLFVTYLFLQTMQEFK